MRERPIYPQQFGEGIPNPVGNATFRGLNADVRWTITFSVSCQFQCWRTVFLKHPLSSRTSYCPPSDAAPLVEISTLFNWNSIPVSKLSYLHSNQYMNITSNEGFLPAACNWTSTLFCRPVGGYQ